MTRSLPLVALAVATLLAPAAALAAPTAAPVNRSFEIRALVLGTTRVEVSGKLWIQGTNLGASVGCNMIGAQVTVDGNVVTVVGPTMTTEMACPGFDGNAEAMLGKVLDLGRFTIADGRWSGEGGAIEVVEQPASDPNAVPPDQPTSNDPGVVCATIIDPGQTDAVDEVAPPPGGASGSGSGSSGGSSGSEPSGPAKTGPQATCELIKGGAVTIDPAPGGPALPAAAELATDARHDAGFGAWPIGLGLLILVAAGLVRRIRPTPR